MMRLIRKIFPVIFLFYSAEYLYSQTPAAPVPGASQNSTTPPQKDPYNRVSPQSSVIAFLESCRNKDFDRASRYLDLETMSRDQRRTEGPILAQQLGRVLDRDADFDVGELNGSPEGNLGEGVPRNRERIRTYDLNGKTLDLQMERKTLKSGLEVWEFSADSVAFIPELVQMTSDSPIERYLPPILVSWDLAGTPVWRWIGLALVMLAVAALSRALIRLGIAVFRPVVRIFVPKLESALMPAVARPAQIVLVGILLRAGVEWLAPPALLRLYLTRLCMFLLIIGGTWFAANLVDLVIEQIRARLDARRNTLSRSALPMASRVVKIILFVFAATAIIGSWGYNTSTILAGLGIGGIAIALAAQKTIENLFGGVAVVSDRPVVVGDVCKFGDRVGTVEDIGLRSTRVRTPDRTMVSIPNAEFSSMVLENFSQRDKVLFHTTLNLRRDTSPDQVRKVLDAIQRILTENPIIEVGPLPVRFIGAGQYSLNVEIFAYIRTANYDEFLKIQQDLLLKIMDEISAAGTALALPAQESVSYANEFENRQSSKRESAN
jgi:MscS family membrane protein